MGHPTAWWTSWTMRPYEVCDLRQSLSVLILPFAKKIMKAETCFHAFLYLTQL